MYDSMQKKLVSLYSITSNSLHSPLRCVFIIVWVKENSIVLWQSSHYFYTRAYRQEYCSLLPS